MPIESDIGRAYTKYYTHAPQANGTERSEIERVKAALILAYNYVWRFTPIYTQRQEIELMCLRELSPGRVLEVGCGSGQQLAALRARGWDVQGLEVDEHAAAHARNAFGVPVFCGTLHQASFGDEEFDAVVMSHVIEHVYDPIGLLRESRRVLKRGGHLVSITPNSEGWGHARFRRSWFGLDPPRHLFLFSRKTLEHIAQTCGFRDVETSTTAVRAEWAVGGSLRVEQGEPVRKFGPLLTRAVHHALLHAQALLARRHDPDAGDECVLRARK
jgi:SAM-dependent methyltransferase